MDKSEECKLIIKFGKTAHEIGIPDGQLESYLIKLSKAFGIEGEFRSAPNHLIFAFRTGDEFWQKINMTSISSREFNMTKLAELDKIVNKIVSNDLDLASADIELDSFDSLKDSYGIYLTALSYFVFGAGFAAILSGGWLDILFSGVLSLFVFIMILADRKNAVWILGSIPTSTAFIAGFFAVLIKSIFPELNYVLVSLSAIIVLVPGYGISIGISEIVNNNSISGIGNLLNGMVYLLKQFTGAWIGFKLAGLIVTIPNAAAHPIDPDWLWLFLPLMFFGLLFIFQISQKDFIWAFMGCVIGYLGVVFGSKLFGSNLGNLIGATGISSYSILWERKFKRPGSIVFLPAVMILVGGSSGFRGLIAAAQGDVSGQSQFMEMFYIAFTITAGLIIANTVFKTKKKL